MYLNGNVVFKGSNLVPSFHILMHFWKCAEDCRIDCIGVLTEDYSCQMMIAQLKTAGPHLQ